MLVKIEISNLKPTHPVNEADIRAIVTATLSRAIMYAGEIPDRIRIEVLDDPIRKIASGKVVSRTAQLLYNSISDFVIQVSALNRTRDEVINSIYHELCHLLRILSGVFKLDVSAEEAENLIDMKANYPPVGWIAGVLLLDSLGELDSIADYEKIQQDTGTGRMVCEGNSGPGARLPVSQATP